jgi:hypothetical protein
VPVISVVAGSRTRTWKDDAKKTADAKAGPGEGRDRENADLTSQGDIRKKTEKPDLPREGKAVLIQGVLRGRAGNSCDS